MEYFVKFKNSILVVVLLVGCSAFSTQSRIDKKMFYKTWYVKSITLNGVEDREEYPNNNDELILRETGEYIINDKVFDYTEKGIWSINQKEELVFKEESNEVSAFKIIKLTESSLVIAIIEGGEELKMFYKSTIDN